MESDWNCRSALVDLRGENRSGTDSVDSAAGDTRSRPIQRGFYEWVASRLFSSVPCDAVFGAGEPVRTRSRLGEVASTVSFGLAALSDRVDSLTVICAACVSAALHDLLPPCALAAGRRGSGDYSTGMVERCADRICSITLRAVRTVRLCARF